MNRQRESGPDNWPGIFANLLCSYRERAGYTQLRLSIELGFSDAAVSMWETKQRLPNDSVIFHKLGKCLGLTLEEERALLNAWLVDKNCRDLQPYLSAKEKSGHPENLETPLSLYQTLTETTMGESL